MCHQAHVYGHSDYRVEKGVLTMGPVISKEAFLATDDAQYREVDVPGWGTVRIRSLSGAGRDTYMKAILQWQEDGTSRVKTADAEAHLLALTLVDEEGKPWFSNVEEGVKVLREKNAASLQKAFFVAMELSGLQEEAIEVAAEGLGETPSEEPGSS